MFKLCILLFTVFMLTGCSSKVTECGFFVNAKDKANCERVYETGGHSF